MGIFMEDLGLETEKAFKRFLTIIQRVTGFIYKLVAQNLIYQTIAFAWRSPKLIRVPVKPCISLLEGRYKTCM